MAADPKSGTKSLSLESLKFEGYESYVDTAVASLRAEFLDKAEEIRSVEAESDELLTKNLNAIQTRMAEELEDFLMTTVTITQTGADKLRKHSAEARSEAAELVKSAREDQRRRSAELMQKVLDGVAKKFDDELEGHQSKMSQRYFEANESLNEKMAKMRQAKELELRDKYALNRELVSDHNRAVAQKAAAEVKAEALRQAELWKPLQEEHAALKRRYELLEYKLKNAEAAQEFAKKRLEFYEPPFLNGPKVDITEDSQWGFLDDSLLSTLVEVGIRRGNLSSSSLIAQATFARRTFGHDGIYFDDNNYHGNNNGRFPNIHRRSSHLDSFDKKSNKHHKKSGSKHHHGSGHHKSPSPSPLPSPRGGSKHRSPTPDSPRGGGGGSSNSSHGSHTRSGRSTSRNKDGAKQGGSSKHKSSGSTSSKESKSKSGSRNRSKKASKRVSTVGHISSSSFDNDGRVISSDHHHHHHGHGHGHGSHHGHHDDHHHEHRGNLHRRTSHRHSVSSHGGGSNGGGYADGGLVDTATFEATFGVGSGGLLVSSGTLNMTKEMLLLKGTICALKTMCNDLKTESDKNKAALTELDSQTVPLLKAQLSVESKRSVTLTQKVAELTAETKRQKKLLNEQEILLKEMTKRETLLRDSLEGSMGSKALEAALASDDLSKRKSQHRRSSCPASPTGTLTPTNRRSSIGSIPGTNKSASNTPPSNTPPLISSANQTSSSSAAFIANRNKKLSKVTLSLEEHSDDEEDEAENGSRQRLDSLASSIDNQNDTLPETPSCPTKEEEIKQVKELWEQQNNKNKQKPNNNNDDNLSRGSRGSSGDSDLIPSTTNQEHNNIHGSSSTSSSVTSSSASSSFHSAGVSSSLFNSTYTLQNSGSIDTNPSENNNNNRPQLSVGTLLNTRTKSSEKIGNASESLLHIKELDDEMEPDSAGVLKNVDQHGNIITQSPKKGKTNGSFGSDSQETNTVGNRGVGEQTDEHVDGREEQQALSGADYNNGFNDKVDETSEYRGAADVSDRSGVHVSYLEELHQHERSELAQQMATLALASQEKDMLLKSLTDALKKQKQTTLKLEAQLSQTSQRQWHHVPDPNYEHSTEETNRRLNNGSRVVANVNKTQPQLELPAAIPRYPSNQTNSAAYMTKQQQHQQGKGVVNQIMKQTNPKQISESENLRIAVDSIELEPSSTASGVEITGGDNVISEGTREVMKRSFLMQKNGGIGDSAGVGDQPTSNGVGRRGTGTNHGGGSIMTKSSPPLLMAAARTHSPTRHQSFANGPAAGRGARGPRGSRLNNRNPARISYESKLF